MNVKIRKLNSIVCIEPNVKYAPHSRLNAALLCHISLKYPTQICYFYACSSHIREVLLHLIAIPPHLSCKPIRVPAYNFTYILYKDIFQLIQTLSILLIHRKAASIYMFGALPITHFALSFLSRFALLSSPLTIVMHGQFESLSPSSSLGLSKWYYKFSCNLVCSNDKLNYVALSEGIKQRIFSLFPSRFIQKKIRVLPHPYFSERFLVNPCNTSPQAKDYPESGALVIGMLGRIDTSKSFNILLDALSYIHFHKVSSKLRINIVLIGNLSAQIPHDLINYFTITSYRSYLDQASFSRLVSSIHFSLFLDGFGSHTLKPSGSFFESLLYEKPVISMGSQFVHDFQGLSGPTGIVLEGTSKLISFLVNPLNFVPKSEYFRYVNNIKRLKQRLDISNFV